MTGGVGAASSAALTAAFLSTLEEAETTLLAWGVVDGSFTHDELLERADLFLEAHADHDVSAAELVENMLVQKLVFQLPSQAGSIYRTRMAEALRLFVRLRQLFKEDQWRHGASLVSDYRFSLRPRLFPRRDVTTDQALQRWADAGLLYGGYRDALVALLRHQGIARLSGFQVRSTERLLTNLSSDKPTGTIVTVGTGSGKTLAFYLPALAFIAEELAQHQRYTKVVAVYPRNELLKDQVGEAFRAARGLDESLANAGRRKLTIGTFFGPTPHSASDVKRKWRPAGGGFVCPYLRCPAPSCEGNLIWRQQDIQDQEERLVCDRCSNTIGGDEIVLTRHAMRAAPADVLFTTTEMLNRSMSDGQCKHVFGIGATHKPRMMLLDEVHTYSGVHGAQVALLIRRWRHAVGGAVQFTGLSATLRDAVAFFAALTGLSGGSVQEITPSQAELVREGMEYLVALKGDPVSKTSLLSTTIQASMLIGRVLDPAPANQTAAPTAPAYGSRTFVFTDDLDVTNRLYHKLMDAEGLTSSGHPQRNRKPYAALRARSAAEQNKRMPAGQSWYVCEEIGHPEGLSVPLRIGRTSSQDTGVDRSSDVIVATASLEVGFNDPAVGAIVQHKAPRDAASFLQRKGRAGRVRSMRPWTVVILSDYARDRLAYQAYDSLFDPVLDAKRLPVGNRFVLRMQAVYAMLEWLGSRLPDAMASTSVWLATTKPATAAGRECQKELARIIRLVLTGDKALEKALRKHLEWSLRIAPAEVTAVMWEPPRSLMLHVMPTLLRRLDSQWNRVPSASEDSTKEPYTTNPLPEFIPPSLFADLSLPEVVVTTPAPRATTRAPEPKERVDSLAIVQALRTLAPGKVTRRFAVEDGRVSHWIQPGNLSDDAVQQTMAVDDICAEFEELGEFEIRTSIGTTSIRCIRPWSLRPVVVPNGVSDTSNAFLSWRTQFLPRYTPVELEIPAKEAWADIIHRLDVYSHAYGSHIEVRRFAVGSDATISRPRKPDLVTRIDFIDPATGQPAGIGFSAHLDGLRIILNRPRTPLLEKVGADESQIRATRTAYFHYRVQADVELEARTNTFQRDWLSQIYLAALAAYALGAGISLCDANAALRAGQAQAAARKVLEVIFEATLSVDELSEDGTSEAAPGRLQQLSKELLEFFAEELVLARLGAAAGVLWNDLGEDCEAWAHDRYKAAIAGAAIQACTELYPEARTDDLLADLDSGVRPPDLALLPSGSSEVWITEATLGGGGVLEEVARRYMDDPRRFFRLMDAALSPSDYEVVDRELTWILGALPQDPELATAFEHVRAAVGHSALAAAVAQLEAVLAERGVAVTHVVMSAVHARILRPGSSAETDRLLKRLVESRRSMEAQLGVEIDPRVFAYLASKQADFDAALQHIDPAINADPAFRFHVVYGLMWPRGYAIQSAGLAEYNPYHALPVPDRIMVLAQVPNLTPSIAWADPDWRERMTQVLESHGAARLEAAFSERTSFRDALLGLGTEPIELGFMHLYPMIEAVARTPDGFSADIYLAEAAQ